MNLIYMKIKLFNILFLRRLAIPVSCCMLYHVTVSFSNRIKIPLQASIQASVLLILHLFLPLYIIKKGVVGCLFLKPSRLCFTFNLFPFDHSFLLKHLLSNPAPALIKTFSSGMVAVAKNQTSYQISCWICTKSYGYRTAA